MKVPGIWVERKKKKSTAFILGWAAKLGSPGKLPLEMYNLCRMFPRTVAELGSRGLTPVPAVVAEEGQRCSTLRGPLEKLI